MSEQHNLKSNSALVCTMHKDKLIATIQIKSLKIQSYVPTIFSAKYFMG